MLAAGLLIFQIETKPVVHFLTSEQLSSSLFLRQGGESGSNFTTLSVAASQQYQLCCFRSLKHDEEMILYYWFCRIMVHLVSCAYTEKCKDKEVTLQCTK